MAGRGEQGSQRVHAEVLESRQLLAANLLAGEGPGMGARPVAVVAADLNGDGKPDLAIANGAYSDSGPNVSIALGLGDGTFQNPTTVQLSGTGNLSALAIGDMDGDGRADLIVGRTSSSNVYQGSVTIIHNYGDGTFSVGSATTISDYPSGIAIGDLNGDAKPDIAIASRNIQAGTGSLTLITTNGYGGFNSPVTITSPLSLRDVSARDMDGDGKTDLIVAAEYGTIGLGLMHGNGDGMFAAPVAVVSGTNYRAVTTGDLNDDGVPDIAATTVSGAQATVQFGNGDGTFSLPATYPLGNSGLEIVRADLNADGKPDLITAGGDGVTVLMNAGSGAFTPRKFFGGDNVTGVAVADLDSDGHADLAVASNYSSSVSVLLGRGDGTFPSPLVTPVTGTDAVTVNHTLSGDFDGDGQLDLIVVNVNNAAPNANTASLAFRHGNGDGTFAEPLTISSALVSSPGTPVLGDFNGDGKLDVAVASAQSYYLFVLLGNGDGTFAAPVKSYIFGYNSSLVALDFNNDGNTDLAVIRSSSVVLLPSLGDGRFTYSSTSYGISATALVTADFNRDGNADLAAADSNGVTPLLGNGDGTFTPQTKTSVGSNLTNLAVGDYSGDGILDLAVIYGSTVAKLQGTAAGTFVSNGSVGSLFLPVNLTIADFDGDGKGDIVAADAYAAYVYPGKAYSYTRTLAIGYPNTSLTTGDFTGDGRPDLLSTTSSEITVTPGLATTTTIADPTVSAVKGVLTISSANATLDAAAGAPGELLVATGTRQTWLATDSITQVVLSGAAISLNVDLGALTGHAVALTVDYGSMTTLAASQHVGALTINGVATVPAGSSEVLRVTGLTFGFHSKLDLNDNDLICDYSTFSPVATIRSQISAARAGGAWTGYGFTSTVAKNNATHSTTLGYMTANEYKSIYGSAATFDGEAIDDTAVLVKYTLSGDADFSGSVNFNDFLRLQAAFNQANTGFAGGNFDYDTTTNFNDFLLLQANFGNVLAASGAVAHVDVGQLPVILPPTPPAPPPAVKTASISGMLFGDVNRNGKYDKGDIFAPGRTVWLDLDNDGVKDANEPSAVTDAKGNYTFKNLAAGSYHVRRVFPKGYIESTPPRYITLSSGQAVTGVQIGSKAG